MTASQMARTVSLSIVTFYLLTIFVCWFSTLNSGEALTVEGLVMVLLLMPWLVVFHFLFENVGVRGFDSPQWITVAIAISALLNAGLLYVLVCYILKGLAAIFGQRSATLDDQKIEQ
jgi:hypothetical protein